VHVAGADVRLNGLAHSVRDGMATGVEACRSRVCAGYGGPDLEKERLDGQNGRPAIVGEELK